SGLSSGRAYCLASGLSESGAFPVFFAGGGRRAAEAGAEWFGGGSGAAVCAGGGLAGASACGGSEFMMLTGGIDCDDGKVTLGPAGTPVGVPPPPEASGRVRVGQFTA